MAKEISIIRQEAQQVQNATQVGENTAQRVGGVLVDIVDKAEEHETDIDNLNANTGVDDYPVFSASEAYSKGKVVNYNGKLYKFTADHAAGAWTGTDVEETSMADNSKTAKVKLEDLDTLFTGSQSAGTAGTAAEIMTGLVPTVYDVMGSQNVILGKLFAYSDSMRHVITQVLFTSMTLDDNGALIDTHKDGITHMYYRAYGVMAPSLTNGKWTEWKQIVTELDGGTYMQTLEPGDTPITSLNNFNRCENHIYFASIPGTYTKAGNIVVEDGELALIFWNWRTKEFSKKTIYKGKISNIVQETGYVTCPTAAGIAAKTVAKTNFALSTGCRLIVKMTNYNTASSPTLDINNTGAKPLYYNGEVASADNTWKEGEVLDVYYDGTNYQSFNTESKSVIDNVVKKIGIFNAYDYTPNRWYVGSGIGNTLTVEDFEDSYSLIIEVNEGEKFEVSGSGGERGRLWYQIKDDKTIVSLSEPSKIGPVMVTIEADVKYLVAQTNSIGHIGCISLSYGVNGEINKLGKALDEKVSQETMVSDADLCISDEEGNILAEFKNGGFRTKEFDSRAVVKNDFFIGKKISILGDSISTARDNNAVEFTVLESDIANNRTLEGYPTYYDIGTTIGGKAVTQEMVGVLTQFSPVSGDAGKVIGRVLNYNNLSQSQLWWGIMADKLGATILQNVSWSGGDVSSHRHDTEILKTAYAWHDAQIRKLATRDTEGNKITPDMVIIYRGCNDYTWAPKAVLTAFGAASKAIPETDVVEDVKYGFKEAYAMTIEKIRMAYPFATIVCCTLNIFKRGGDVSHFPVNNGVNTLPEFNNAIREVADFMGCGLIEFDKDGITFENCYPTYISDSASEPTHPNATGHKKMAEKAYKDMLNII